MIPANTLLGDLKLDEVFIEYDGPQLFSCSDESGQRLLAVHAPATDSDNWIYTYISEGKLDQVRSGLISLRDAFTLPEQDTVFVVMFYQGDLIQVRIEITEPVNIPTDWFPDEGEFLEPQDFQAVSTVPSLALSNSTIQQERDSAPLGAVFNYPPYLSELPSSIIQSNPMWELSAEALTFFRAKRTPISTIAARTGRFVFDIALKTGDQRTDVPVKDLAFFLNTTQKVVESFTSDLSSDPSVKRRGLKFHEETRLDAIASFPSSFGLRIETQAGLFANPAVSSALQRIVALLSTRGKPEIEMLLQGLSNTSIHHFRSFANAVAKNQGGFSIDLGMPDRDESISALLSPIQLNELISSLDARGKKDEYFIEFAGKLIGVSLKTKFFMLEGKHNTISGRIAEQCMNNMYGKTIGQAYTCTLKVLIEIDEVIGNESEKFILISISDQRKQDGLS